jgi:hypothetical protein
MEWAGGCLCGAVRYRASAHPRRVVSCHCGMCRRASGAAFLTFVHFPADAFAWTSAEPTRYRSSAAAERGFCALCGSTLSMHEACSPTASRSASAASTGPIWFASTTTSGP